MTLCAHRLAAALLLTALTTGCAQAILVQQQCYDPDGQLTRVLQALQAARATGCDETTGEQCVRARAAVDRQLVICPVHVPTLMANAVLAYDEGRPVVAQQLLDQVLAGQRSQPDAAALRARIAVEEGNLPFARRLLEQHLVLAPDHAGLHETYGGVLYLAGEMPDARRELATARALGAPGWRVAYHLGLIAEALASPDEAEKHYRESLEQNPDWQPAQARLKALRVGKP